jgi:hypothetical protein
MMAGGTEGIRAHRFVHAIAGLFAVVAAGAAFAQRPYVAIEQRLTPGQMHATGLDQLDAEQLSLLNQLLREEQAAVEVESVAAARNARRTKPARPSPAP